MRYDRRGVYQCWKVQRRAGVSQFFKYLFTYAIVTDRNCAGQWLAIGFRRIGELPDVGNDTYTKQALPGPCRIDESTDAIAQCQCEIRHTDRMAACTNNEQRSFRSRLSIYHR